MEDTTTRDFAPESRTPRRLVWIACGLAAVAFGFVVGRGTHNDINAAPADTETTPPAAGVDPVPVVVELFTSQGCSSCPPADRLLAELASDQPVPGALIVPLSEHVDYWNRLGWTDPFSSSRFSERQRAYAHAAGSRRIYTPQMMVDGRHGFVGSERKEALGHIAKASMEAHADVRLAACDATPDCWRVEIEGADRVGEADAIGNIARVVYAVTESNLEVDVPRGENAGRELSHVAVVRWMDELGSVGSAGTFSGRVRPQMDSDWDRENLRIVVFVQEEESRRILGAGSVPVG